MSGTTSLGTYLRDLRARRGLSLDEVARLTRVASRYIEALEADAFGALPAPVFTRGYIRAYCQALHEPVEEALALYHSQSVRTASVPTQPVKVATPPPSAESEARSRSTVLVSFILLVILGLALFGVTLALQSGKDTTEKRTVDTTSSPSLSPSSTPAIAEAPSPPVSEPVAAPPPVVTPRVVSPPPVATVHTAPPAVASVHATPPTPVPSASPATPPSAPSAPAAAPPATPDLSGVVAAVTSPYHLVARVSEPTWIRVRTEDGRLSEETIPAGQVREWVSNGPFVLTIGNAGGVSFELNGRVLPALGPSGAVISRLVLPPQQ
jgi:cytoskeleton protein RodZ